MTKRLPVWPLFVDDFSADTAHLSLVEEGALFRLLRLSWRTPGCSIPDEDKWLKRHMRVSDDELCSVVRPILAEFFAAQRGRLVNPRLQEQYDDALSKSEARAASGRKGGLAKSRKNNDFDFSKATDLPEQNSSNALASRSLASSRSLARSRDERDSRAGSDFEDFWNAYPKKIRRGDAERLWPAALAKAPAEVIIAGARRYAAEVAEAGTEPAFITSPHNWLLGARWADQ